MNWTPEVVSRLLGKYCIVLDEETLRSVARGVVAKIKLNPVPCVSMDNVHFYSLGEENKAECRFYDYDDYDEQDRKALGSFQRIPDDWRKGPWKDRVANPKNVCDVYLEQDFIDPEIIDLVYALNRIHGITTGGSCWGHNDRTAFVTLAIFDFKGFNFLLRCQNSFPDRWNITTDPVTSPNISKDLISLTLRSVYKGVKVCKDIKELTLYILEKGKEEGILIPASEVPNFFPSLE